MTGFDNGTLAGGIFAQAKQFGAVLRGLGPPVPMAGNIGDPYIDAQTWNLFAKRSNGNGDDDNDPWGHYLFVVPVTYRAGLKWFTASPITDDVGVPGDYALAWGGWGNYGMQPSIYGPKTAAGWPENGNGPDTQIDPTYSGATLLVGDTDEGDPIAYSNVTRLIVVGVGDEYVQPTPVLADGGTVVSQIGVQSMPANVAVTLNPLYTAEDTHAV